ncbi:DEAD-box ATP-dependent RNA helicase 13 [Prunus yedoensis var. nudiflora]|uniref:DEAD-box ATP-dependent RNA helicase 13 n=1 Tax=Prunus yedoensis var. nudiflora TaxID=2094558 RepID=A0A314U993_PRUYE|nr:DEAD-box ATP-dependent RNA helicase 13 [Prunus yedoensis var. nudiflora]
MGLFQFEILAINPKSTMLPIPLSRGLKRKAKRKQIQQQDAELKRFDSLPQNPSLPNDDHNAFTNVVGNNELEGGS